MFVKVTACNSEEEFQEILSGMNEATRDWELRAARGECSWICADCCSCFSNGMPDKCDHGHQYCTDLIQRDKKEAWAQVQTEPVKS